MMTMCFLLLAFPVGGVGGFGGVGLVGLTKGKAEIILFARGSFLLFSSGLNPFCLTKSPN